MIHSFPVLEQLVLPEPRALEAWGEHLCEVGGKVG